MYIVQWNVIGEDPDDEPKYFSEWSEAARFLMSELQWIIVDSDDLYLYALAAAKLLSLHIATYSPSYFSDIPDVSYSVGNVVYSIREDSKVSDSDINNILDTTIL